MNVIQLSRKKFETLEPLVLSRDVMSTEAEVYDFRYKGAPKVLKRLFHQEGERFANKLYTVEMLDANRRYLPDQFCIPEALVTVGGNVEGFILPKIDGIPLVSILNDKSLDKKEHIYYLKKIGEILQQLKAIRSYTPLKDIYIGDMHDSNFIANPDKRQLTVIDLDSCKIGNNQSMPGRYLTPLSLLTKVKGKYQFNKEPYLGYVTADEQSDLYCYTIMILNYLLGEDADDFSLEEFYEYLNYLDYIGVDRELIDVFSKIVTNQQNENPMPYLDSLTDENICRAKDRVYKKVKAVNKRNALANS